MQEQGRQQKPRKKSFDRESENNTMGSAPLCGTAYIFDRETPCKIFCVEAVMQSASPAYYWQNDGLTLLHPFSSN